MDKPVCGVGMSLKLLVLLEDEPELDLQKTKLKRSLNEA